MAIIHAIITIKQLIPHINECWDLHLHVVFIIGICLCYLSKVLLVRFVFCLFERNGLSQSDKVTRPIYYNIEKKSCYQMLPPVSVSKTWPSHKMNDQTQFSYQISEIFSYSLHLNCFHFCQFQVMGVNNSSFPPSSSYWH